MLCMDEFDTICLDTSICDICNQDTGEELINCILNDRCLKVGDGSSSAADSREPFKQAHKYCLDRWTTVIQSALHSKKCPSPKRSWKDKLKDLLNRNLENSSDFDAWVEVNNSKSTTESTTTQNLGDTSVSLSPGNNNVNRTTRTKKNSFLTKEEYRVEQLNGDIEECLERGRKLRVRSVDIVDEDESPCNSNYDHEPEGTEKSTWTKEQLGCFSCKELLEIYKCLKKRIEETSKFLVSELEEKDSLRQQYDSLNTTVGQLVQLQQKQKVKTLSLQFENQQHLIT